VAVVDPVGRNWLSQLAVRTASGRGVTQLVLEWQVRGGRTRPGRRWPRGGVDLDELRGECLSKLGELGLQLPVPWSREAFCERLGVCLGRRIVLCPVNTTFATRSGACGSWLKLKTPSAHLFFYERATSPYHKDQILGHEAGHAAFDDPTAEILDEEELAALIRLSPVTVERVAGRTSYDTPRERRAEMFGTVVNELAIRVGPVAPPTPPSEDAAVLSRLYAALTGSPDPDVR
jgi:hypothetical protein